MSTKWAQRLFPEKGSCGFIFIYVKIVFSVDFSLGYKEDDEPSGFGMYWWSASGSLLTEASAVPGV